MCMEAVDGRSTQVATVCVLHEGQVAGFPVWFGVESAIRSHRPALQISSFCPKVFAGNMKTCCKSG